MRSRTITYEKRWGEELLVLSLGLGRCNLGWSPASFWYEEERVYLLFSVVSKGRNISHQWAEITELPHYKELSNYQSCVITSVLLFKDIVERMLLWVRILIEDFWGYLQLWVSEGLVKKKVFKDSPQSYLYFLLPKRVKLIQHSLKPWSFSVFVCYFGRTAQYVGS